MWNVQYVNDDIDIDEDGNFVYVDANEFIIVRYVGGEFGWERYDDAAFETREEAERVARILNAGF